MDTSEFHSSPYSNVPHRSFLRELRVNAKALLFNLDYVLVLPHEDLAKTVALPGARELLSELPDKSWGVVTECTRSDAVKQLEAAGLPIPFVLITGDEVVVGTPNPRAYVLAAQRLGVETDQCLAVEDSQLRIDAAYLAGMSQVGIANGKKNTELHADMVIPSLTQLRVMPNVGDLIVHMTDGRNYSRQSIDIVLQ